MNTDVTIVDQSTGEVLVNPSLETEVSPATVQFLALLERYDLGRESVLLQDETIDISIEPEDQADVSDLYNVNPLLFSDVTNQKLWVYGASIFEIPAGLTKEGNWHARYFQSRILVKIEDQFRIIKSSGQPLMMHIARACLKRGWFYWETPLEYKFIWKGAGEPHIIDRVDKEKIRIIPKSQRGKN